MFKKEIPQQLVHQSIAVVVLAASVIFTVGAIVMGVATSKEVLLVGRIVVGMGIGLASMSVPIYISETVPSRLRGLH